jgi:hypothetical protein
MEPHCLGVYHGENKNKDDISKETRHENIRVPHMEHFLDPLRCTSKIPQVLLSARHNQEQ